MANIYNIFSSGSKIVNEGVVTATRNSESAAVDSLYIRTDVKYTDDRFGNIEAKLNAAINTDLTKGYIDMVSQAERSKIMDEYSNRIINAIGQPNDAFALHNLFNKVNGILSDLHRNGDRKAIIALNKLTKKLNSIHETLQDMRGEADLNIEKSIFEINQLLATVREGNKVLRENQQRKDEQIYVDTQKSIWAATSELAKYFSIATKTLNDGTQEINIVTDREIYNLVGRSSATEFAYKSEGVSNILSEEPFNRIVLRKLGVSSKSLYAVDDFTVVSSGTDSTNTEYKIQSGILGGLLEARDGLLADALTNINKLSEKLMRNMNSMHNALTSRAGAPLLSGSVNFNLDSTVAAQGKALIALVDENGRPANYEGQDFVPLELDMAELDLNSTGQTNVRSIITRINDYFSADNRRVEVSGLYDIKLVSKSPQITNTNILELGIEVTNAMQTSETGFKITNLKVTNGAGIELKSDTNLNTLNMIAAGARQKIIPGLSIDTNNSIDASGNPIVAPTYPYTVELIVEVQSIDDSGPVYSKIVYEIGDPAFYANNVNGILGKSFSAKEVLPPNSGDTNFGKLKVTNPTNILTSSLVNESGAQISEAGIGGFLELRTNTNKYKIAILQVDEQMSGKANNVDRMLTAGFSEFFGLNDLFRPRDASNFQNYKNAAKDISIRNDILKNSKLFSYSQLTIYRKEGEKGNVVSSCEVGLSNYRIESKWPIIATDISKNIGNLIFHSECKHREFKSLHENQVSILENIEAELNTQQGFDDDQSKYDLFQLSSMQSALSIAFSNTLKVNQAFLDAFK
ncbi:MAG: Flagellar hook-associated protein FlgK [Candidatus Midichloria mitochondrii]|nr:hypothetical protein [Candidatus Midichloria mitochondrii]MDJ1288116.1 hypothetical protein [Candidatus Midichloria mitochondrii]MDJ1298955.1 hypothetical protein [Candidatus Midichloria mitochondrii]